MQLIFKFWRIQLYFCIGKVYCVNQDDWARQAFTLAWLSSTRRVLNIEFGKAR